MTIYGYLLLMLFILSNLGVEGNYSINSVIQYLQETGYYDLFQAIKIEFGDDVAIGICILLIPSYDCQTIIKVYMTETSHIYRALRQLQPVSDINKEISIIEDPQEFKLMLQKEIKINKKVEPIIDLILFRHYNILLRNLGPKEIMNFFKKVNRMEVE